MKIHFKQDPPHPPFTYSFLGPIIPLSTLFSDNLSLGSSLSLKYQVSHSYKTTEKIVILCIRVFERRTGKKKILNRLVADIL